MVEGHLSRLEYLVAAYRLLETSKSKEINDGVNFVDLVHLVDRMKISQS
jgi:hypothetical protein